MRLDRAGGLGEAEIMLEDWLYWVGCGAGLAVILGHRQFVRAAYFHYRSLGYERPSDLPRGELRQLRIRWFSMVAVRLVMGAIGGGLLGMLAIGLVVLLGRA